MTWKFRVVGEVLMRMAERQTGEAMTDIERTMISSLAQDNKLPKKIMGALERRWERRAFGSMDSDLVPRDVIPMTFRTDG